MCLFKHNILDAEQVARLNDGLRRLLVDHIPPFLALDQEGGNVVRVRDQVVVLPSNMALGATRYLMRPLSPEQLVAEVRACLRRPPAPAQNG